LKARFVVSAVAATAASIGVLGALGGYAAATEPDTTPPAFVLSGSAIKAVEEEALTGSYELHIAATDGSESAPQSGIAKIEVSVDGSGQQSWEKYCPEGSCALEESWAWLPANFSGAYHVLTVKVTDHAGNMTEEEITPQGIEEVPREREHGIDATPPKISFSGTAVEAAETGATTGEYELRMLASDGTTAEPQSGVAKIEVAVDGTALQSFEKYCPVGNCRLRVNWPYDPGNFSGTEHVITVTVRDHAGNVTTRTLELDRTPPVVELSGPLTEGLREGTTDYPLHVHATDGEPEFPQSGVKTISIAVDGEVVKSVEQECKFGSCPMDTEWTYDSEEYPGEHEVTVTVADHAGNVTTEGLEISLPDGSIPACDPNGGSAGATPTEETSLEGGGTQKRFALSEGLSYYVLKPPAGFNPLTATEAKLGEYGYPPRPSAEEAQALEQWEAEVTASEGPGNKVCSGSSFLGEFEGGTREGEIWSGFVTVANPGEDKWNGVKGEFIQPAFLNEPYCPNAAEYSWIGLGGYQEEAEEGLVQIGTAIFPNKLRIILQVHAREGKKVFKTHTFYYEEELTVSPEDRVYAFLEYRPAIERLYFNMVDHPKGSSEHHSLGRRYLSPLSPKYFAGSSAEFIDERPTFGQAHKELPSFKNIEWRGLGVRPLGKSSWPSPGSYDRRKLIMKGQSPGHEQLMASPGALSEDGREFTDFWHACHP
jgi:hypothetical protein